MSRSVLITAFSIIMAIAGCTTAKKTEAPYVGAAEKVAAETDRQIVSSVEFEKGQRVVNPTAAEGIQKAIAAARAQGEIEKVDVVVWSDMEYPATGPKLSKSQKELAKERGDSVKTFIGRQAPSADVNVVNMAERPSPLAKLFNTEDAVLKRKLTAMGFAPGPDNQFETGRPSTALILVQVK